MYTNGINHPETLNDRIDSLASNLKSVVDHLSTRATSFKDKASEAKSYATASATSFADKTGKAIKDHPIAALGIAFGIGYLVMRLIRR
jgi:ElaB/YqjD/DUF883 family membrane-anchored ribosome-binding protein